MELREKIDRALSGILEHPRMYAGHLETLEVSCLLLAELTDDGDDTAARWRRWAVSRGYRIHNGLLFTALERDIADEEQRFRVLAMEFREFTRASLSACSAG